MGEIKGLLRGKEGIKEIPRIQRYVTRPSPEGFFNGKRMRTERSRDEAVYTAYSEYGYTIKEIVKYLGVHYAPVSRALRRMERQRQDVIM